MSAFDAILYEVGGAWVTDCAGACVHATEIIKAMSAVVRMNFFNMEPPLRHGFIGMHASARKTYANGPARMWSSCLQQRVDAVSVPRQFGGRTIRAALHSAGRRMGLSN